MAFPGNVKKVVFSGAMPGGEVWSSGFYGAAIADSSSAQSAADAIAGAAYMAQLMTSHRAMNISGTTLARVTVYKYGAGEAATDVGVAAITDNSGTWSTVPHPTSVACCLILRSANAARAGKGRMFWPATGCPMTTTGEFQASTIQTFVNNLGFALKSNAASVVSQKLTLSQPVTRVTADTRPDTIRARYDKIAGADFSYSF